MSFLAKLEKEVKKIAPAFLIYGEPGSSKTSFAAQLQDVMFVCDDNDKGLADLQNNGRVRGDIPKIYFSDWDTLNGIIDELLAEKGAGFKWVALDGLSGVERVLWKFVCDTQYAGNMTSGESGFMAWGGKGRRDSVPLFEDFLRKLERLRSECGVGVCLIAHSKIDEHTDPQNGSYNKYVVDCFKDKNGGNYEPLMKWATLVGFINYVTGTKKVNNEIIASGGQIRQLHLCRSATFEAKNRNGITEPIQLGNSAEEGFANFKAALAAAKK